MPYHNKRISLDRFHSQLLVGCMRGSGVAAYGAAPCAWRATNAQVQQAPYAQQRLHTLSSTGSKWQCNDDLGQL